MNLTGQRFGRLVVLSYSHSDTRPSGRARHYVNCACDCGNMIAVWDSQLKSGGTLSCGCLQRERASEAHLTHGHTKNGARSKVYNTYHGIDQRCYNPQHHKYPNYGGRGIGVFSGWRGEGGFEKFYAYIGDPPSPQHQIDRIDNNGSYVPGNIHWATRIEQMNNMRSNHLIEHVGESLTLTQWSERLGIKQSTLRMRLGKYGWSIERAFTTPVRVGNGRLRSK